MIPKHVTFVGWTKSPLAEYIEYTGPAKSLKKFADFLFAKVMIFDPKF